MKYLEYKKWELQNIEIIISDTLRDVELANEQLNKAIVDSNIKLIKYWGSRAYALEKELPYYEWQRESLKKEVEQ